MNSMRGGMQVHAVPESERALDASGKRLPWGYEFADAEIGRRREPEEKGPFGRSVRRRGFSRSKTATPARKEDVVRQENMQTEDFIFAKYKDELKAKDPVQPTQKPNEAQASQAAGDAASAKEATEVILYGFGPDSQWAAIEYYERISNGIVYEDYDRHPPHQRYDHSLTYSRAKLAQRSLSQAALRKRNAYRGGDHWIKVTFDSPEAADLACHCSPHPIHGFLVYAEPFRGIGPPNDAPIPYSNAGAQIDGPALPSTFSTRDTLTPTDSSNTISSATITAAPSSSSPTNLATTSSSKTTALDPTTPAQKRPMRIPGATRAILKPADLAFAEPSKSVSSSLASWPLVNLFVGTKGDVIGSAVPRTDDGSFDWKNASLYWLIFAWLDYWLGTDMCGLRGDD
ncbi:hypothetical protein E4T49_02933 [Aureobasidium sp. EXF-10728]|nr:hypothetical protein E4T49_02933 [Aureobasidium sp. EXF-10728]